MAATKTSETDDLLSRLDYAKKAVQSCLESSRVTVDFHDIVYWAGRVKALREEVGKL